MSEKGTETKVDTALLERLFSVGAHYGFSKSRRHPTVAPYIFGAKNRTEIIDLEKTSEQLMQAKEAVRALGKERKILLFVGGKNEAQGIIRKAAESTSAPFVVGRWLGGTLTNFAEIHKRIKRLRELTEQREKGELSHYTKLERLMIDREIDDLMNNFGGIVALEKVPDALFVIDPRYDHIAVAEANQLNIPVVAVAGSDCDISKVAYPMVANDASVQSIQFFVDEIARAYKEGFAETPVREESKTQG